MPLIGSEIASKVMLRIGAFQGSPTTIDGNYSTPYTNSVSESVTPNSIKADLLHIEQEIATIVASNDRHPWRNLIADVTALIPSGSLIPSVGSGGSKIIGVYGQVRDSDAPNRILTKDLNEDEIRIIIASTNVFQLTMFACAIHPPRIYHTRPNGCLIDVCVYDYDTRKTAINADNALLFQSAADMYFYGAMSMLKNTDARLNELSNQFMPLYDAWRQGIMIMKDSEDVPLAA